MMKQSSKNAAWLRTTSIELHQHFYLVLRAPTHYDAHSCATQHTDACPSHALFSPSVVVPNNCLLKCDTSKAFSLNFEKMALMPSTVPSTMLNVKSEPPSSLLLRDPSSLAHLFCTAPVQQYVSCSSQPPGFLRRQKRRTSSQMKIANMNGRAGSHHTNL